MQVWGQGYMEISVPSSQFSCECKTALKSKVYFLMKRGKKNRVHLNYIYCDPDFVSFLVKND